MGNFANSEILGVHTDKPWGIIFERIDMLPRHPAQLYEAISYFIIFIAMWLLYRLTGMKQKYGTIFGLYLVLTFGSRFMIEFVKERQAEYAHDWAISTGQWLSVPFIMVGLFFWLWPYVQRR